MAQPPTTVALPRYIDPSTITRAEQVDPHGTTKTYTGKSSFYHDKELAKQMGSKQSIVEMQSAKVMLDTNVGKVWGHFTGLKFAGGKAISYDGQRLLPPMQHMMAPGMTHEPNGSVSTSPPALSDFTHFTPLTDADR